MRRSWPWQACAAAKRPQMLQAAHMREFAAGLRALQPASHLKRLPLSPVAFKISLRP